MKKMVLYALTLTVISALLCFAQDWTGAWQGTLQAGRELRLVIKVSQGANSETFKAVLYSIDQGGQPLPGTITIQGNSFKMVIPGAGGTFDGKLSADNKSVSGIWSQGGPAIPLQLSHVSGQAAWPVPAAPAPLKAMTDPSPAFEVATIKPSRPDTPGKGIQIRGRQFATINTSLADLIAFAYGVHAKQIVNGPEWLETEKYDLIAQPDGDGQPNDKQWKVMLQKLLANRFKLSFHRDKKELPVYAIVVGRSGPKLTRSEGDPNGLPTLFLRGFGNLPATNATIADLAGTLQAVVLDRPVVDQSGLSGRFDFNLNWTPDEFQFAGLGVRIPPRTDSTSGPPDLFSAFKEQLGLRLESTKAPAEVLVIDKAEKPSAN